MTRDPQQSIPELPEGLLIEGVVTTIGDDHLPHVAPMGPIVDNEFSCLLLRPFRTSVTYQNLKRTGQGVFHVTDDVDLLARAAVGQLQQLPPLRPAQTIDGVILADACRWYEFRIESLDDRDERTRIVARVVGRGCERDFVGFNRAKHAVVEAAILATRIALLDREFIGAEFERLAVIVEKTGGHQERRAFAFLQSYVDARLAVPPPHEGAPAR